MFLLSMSTTHIWIEEEEKEASQINNFCFYDSQSFCDMEFLPWTIIGIECKIQWMNECRKKHCFRSNHFHMFCSHFHCAFGFSSFCFVAFRFGSLWCLHWTLNSELWTVGSITNLVFDTKHDILIRASTMAFYFHFFCTLLTLNVQCSSFGFSYEWRMTRKQT